MNYIGIDCGKTGAFVVIDKESNIIDRGVIPTIKALKGRDYDIKSYYERLSNHKDATFIIENPGEHAPSASGLRSMTFGYAITLGFVVPSGSRYYCVRALEWQRQFWKKPKLPKGQKFDTKAAALATAMRLWPKEHWTLGRSKKPHDGIIDAALLAEYGRINNL